MLIAMARTRQVENEQFFGKCSGRGNRQGRAGRGSCGGRLLASSDRRELRDAPPDRDREDDAPLDEFRKGSSDRPRYDPAGRRVRDATYNGLRPEVRRVMKKVSPG